MQLCWVRGHAGVRGNEIADELAKQAAESPAEATEIIPRSSNYFRAAFKDHLYERWVERWQSTDLSFARQTKIWLPIPSFRKTRKLLSLGRVEFSRVVRWLTGHAFLGLQNFRCGTVVTSFCRLCGQVPERADHLLLRCPRLSLLRADCFRSWALDYPPQWELDWVLKFLRDPVVGGLEDPTNSPEEISGRVDPEDGRDSHSEGRSGQATDTLSSH